MPSDGDIESPVDGSYSPGGDRSRAGAVILFKGCDSLLGHSNTVHDFNQLLCVGDKWSRRRSKAGVWHKASRLRALGQHHYKSNLSQDKMAYIRTLTHGVTPWRTRHYGVKAAWIRDMIKYKMVKWIMF